MNNSPKRETLKKLGLVTGALAAPSLWSRRAAAATLKLKPEAGAKLRLLRWKRFVQGDEDLWMVNVKKFTGQTGIEVRVDNESFEDVRPKAAVAANIGSGPDIILGWLDDPHLYPDKLVDVSDVAEYLGAKYGGWYDSMRRYGTSAASGGKRWIALPVCALGALLNYRVSWMKQAGFNEFPNDSKGFLKLCQTLAKNGHPPGFALSHATGDSETWMHSMLWGHGARMVDENDRVVINSPATVTAIEYVSALAKTFIEGCLGWSGVSNNNAFLEGKISVTSNGISIYYVAKNSPKPEYKAIAADMDHHPMPVGPIGKPTEMHMLSQAMVFKHSKFPNAAKEFLRFMMEKEQYEPWQRASIGYISHPLKAYASNPLWNEDAKFTPFRDTAARMLWNGYAGKLGSPSAASLADWIVVDMFGQAASGQKTPKEAAAEAERRAKRYYK